MLVQDCRYILSVSICLFTYNLLQVLIPFLLVYLCRFILLLVLIKSVVSTSMVSEFHLLIKHIISMTYSATSMTTGKQFLVKSTPIIWVYPRATRRALKWSYLFFLNSHFESIMRLLGGIFLLLGFIHTPLFIMSLNEFLMDIFQPSRSSRCLVCHYYWNVYGLPYYGNSTQN